MKIIEIVESANITDRYRSLEDEFARLVGLLDQSGKTADFEKSLSGNIWENCKVLEKNIELAKKILGQD